MHRTQVTLWGCAELLAQRYKAESCSSRELAVSCFPENRSDMFPLCCSSLL